MTKPKPIPPIDPPTGWLSSVSPRRPAMRQVGSEWQVGFRSEYTGDWKETVDTYTNRGHAVARYRGLLKRWGEE